MLTFTNKISHVQSYHHHHNHHHGTETSQLASCLIYSYALIEYINHFAVDRMVTFLFMMLPSVKFAEEKVLVFFIFHEK